MPGDSDDNDMVDDMKQFDNLLKSRRYPGLRIDSRVFADEDHYTVAPHIITHGLKWILPPPKYGRVQRLRLHGSVITRRMVSSGTPCDSRYQVATSTPMLSSVTRPTATLPAISLLDLRSAREMMISQRIIFMRRSGVLPGSVERY